MLKEKCLIIFDLDGTLIDSVPDITEAINHTFRRGTKDKISRNLVEKLMGKGSRELIKQIQIVTGDKQTASQLSLERRFYEMYSTDSFRNSKIYEGVVETLEKLKSKKKYVLACLTNKPEEIAKNILKKANLENYFELVRGASGSRRLKPCPTNINAITKKLKIKRDRTILIGDSNVDYETAKFSGISCILLSCGYSRIKSKTDSSVISVVSSIRETTLLTENYFSKKIAQSGN